MTVGETDLIDKHDSLRHCLISFPSIFLHLSPSPTPQPTNIGSSPIAFLLVEIWHIHEDTINMDFSLENHQSYIGRPATDLPTPSLVLSKPVLERNINALLQDVKDLNIAFRPHVKTLKVRVTEIYSRKLQPTTDPGSLQR